MPPERTARAEHPDVTEAREALRETCEAHGIPFPRTDADLDRTAAYLRHVLGAIEVYRGRKLIYGG